MGERTLSLVCGNANNPLSKKNTMNISHQTKSRTTIWSSYTTSGYIERENKVRIDKRYLIPMFIVAAFIITNLWNQSKCPTAGD
jgi:hypothetical protein